MPVVTLQTTGVSFSFDCGGRVEKEELEACLDGLSGGKGGDCGVVEHEE